MDELGAVFLACIPAELRERAGVSLEADLHALVDRARAAAPDAVLDPAGFVAHVAERVTFDAAGRPLLRGLHAGDLWVAFGCLQRDAQAIVVFEKRFAPEITSALRRSFEAGLAEDAELRLREKLMLVDGDDSPRLASYAGRGALGPWLRAVAVRTAIDVMRARREVPADPATLGEPALIDPLLAGLKERYRDELKVAFDESAAELTNRDRTLLRYRFVDDLSIDEIGVLYHVHRATVARWIAAIRETLFEATRKRLMTRLAISDSDVDSVLRLIDSQLDFSIGALVSDARAASP